MYGNETRRSTMMIWLGLITQPLSFIDIAVYATRLAAVRLAPLAQCVHADGPGEEPEVET